MYWAEKMPQLVKILLAFQARGLEFDPRTHAKTNLAAVESSAGEVKAGGLGGSLASHPNLHGGFKASKRPRLKPRWMGLEEQHPSFSSALHMHTCMSALPHTRTCARMEVLCLVFWHYIF